MILTLALQVCLDFKRFVSVVFVQAVLDAFVGSVEAELGLLEAVIEALFPVSVLAVAAFTDHLALIIKSVHLGFGIGINELHHVDGILTRAVSALLVTAKSEADQARLVHTVVVVLVLLLFAFLLLVLALLVSFLVLVVVLHLLLVLILLPVLVGRLPFTASKVLDRQAGNVELVVGLVLVVLVGIVLVALLLVKLTEMTRRFNNLGVLKESLALARLEAQRFGGCRRQEKTEDGLLEHVLNLMGYPTMSKTRRYALQTTCLC